MLWGPSRHLGSLTVANWVCFDFNVSYSSCWGYSLINTFKFKKKRKSSKNRRLFPGANLVVRPASKSQKRDFRDFSEAKGCYSNRNVKFKNFMQSKWREEKSLKGIVGNKTRLHFWNKDQKKNLVFMQLARNNWTHERVLKYQYLYQEIWLIN